MKLKKLFKWSMTSRHVSPGKVCHGETAGYASTVFRVPFYVPLEGAHSLRRVIKIHKRATRLAEDLRDALLDLNIQIAENERIFIDKATETEPPEKDSSAR